jgi:hypothetical protein
MSQGRPLLHGPKEQWELDISHFTRSRIEEREAKKKMVRSCGDKFKDKPHIESCRRWVCECILEGYPEEQRKIVEETEAYCHRGYTAKKTAEQLKNQKSRDRILNDVAFTFRSIVEALGFNVYLTPQECVEKEQETISKKNARRISLDAEVSR